MRLQELRRARNISQLKLAMDLGLNQNSISRCESGVRQADYRTLILFADYFNVSIGYLPERTDNPPINQSALHHRDGTPSRPSAPVIISPATPSICHPCKNVIS